MAILPVALFKQAGTITGSETLVYPANSISLIPLPADPKERLKWAQDKAFTLYDITQFFPDFTARPNARLLFTHLGGGIGDVLAFSAVAEYLRGRTITAHCLPQHHVLFKWFTNHDIKLKGMYEPIFTDFTSANRITKYAQYARLRLEYAAIEAREVNWYDAMFARLGVPTPVGLTRPQLVERQEYTTQYTKSILIQHRASCQIRSSSLADFYEPVRRVYPKASICVFESDLTQADKAYAKTVKITVLPALRLEQYLFMLQRFALVVSTDSSAIHFREGLGKPCLSVYGAMTTESRTRDYIYTRSFNVQTGCQYQPCFKHQLSITDFCPAHTPGENTAKCQSGEAFREQLFTELSNYR